MKGRHDGANGTRVAHLRARIDNRTLAAGAGLIAALATALVVSGCHDEDWRVDPVCGEAHAPVGLYSVTGDEAVAVYWIPVPDAPVDEFVVYRANTPTGTFREVGHTTRDYFVDDTVVNGETYYYAVSAVDPCGAETDLSYEIVQDTPRPEGFGEHVFDANGDDWPRSGWELDLARAVPWDSPSADFYFIRADGVPYLVAADLETDIQDAGFGDFDSVDWAPNGGWSPTGTAEVIPGHVYVVWTRDNHFAKVRARSLTSDVLEFDWAYQIDEGNPELSPRPSRESAPLSVRPGRGA
jgi:hypothetical protein